MAADLGRVIYLTYLAGSGPQPEAAALQVAAPSGTTSSGPGAAAFSSGLGELRSSVAGERLRRAAFGPKIPPSGEAKLPGADFGQKVLNAFLFA
jgi:hypothetical protein